MSVSLRPWFLASTPHEEAVNESSEQDAAPCRTGNLSHSDDGKTIRIRPSLPVAREIYPGDRFISRRYGHSFQAAHYLLKQQFNDSEDKREIDYCKQVELLDVTYRRKAMRAIMISQECVPGLNQKRVLRTFVERGQGLSYSDTQGYSGSETEGKWKCVPRKRPLIRSPEKMLSLSTDQSDNDRPIDWNCMDMVVVSRRNGLTIYDSNGTGLDTLHSWDAPVAVKWSNDGMKIAWTCRNTMRHKLYDSRKKKFLWSIPCQCYINNYTTCSNCCICWSQDDRLIVTACKGMLSIFQSDTGELRLNKRVCFLTITTLNFSPNFKYLVSTAQDNRVRIYTWPNLTEWYYIGFSNSIKAVAWHPETSGLLCIGGSSDASLSLWNINTYAMIDYLPAKFQGRVENLAWNKLSGELVVHWSYAVENKRHSVFPILANFERIVDAIPLDKDERLTFLKFGATHKQLVTYCNDVFSMWNFFGDEKPPGGRCLPLYSIAEQRQGVIVRKPIR